MSKHVWLVKDLRDDSLGMVAAGTAYAVAIEQGATYDRACLWVGYVMERLRQQAGFLGRPSNYHGISFKGDIEIKWNNALRRGNIYARSKNAANYTLAGKRAADRLGWRFGMPEAPGQVLYDALVGTGDSSQPPEDRYGRLNTVVREALPRVYMAIEPDLKDFLPEYSDNETPYYVRRKRAVLLADLCMDGDRPVDYGGMKRVDYDYIIKYVPWDVRRMWSVNSLLRYA